MTEHAYILGHPIAHSKSPAMHNAAYQALGLDWEYGFADCETTEDARAFLMSGDWRACNVTMPYKPLALEAADTASAAASAAGGANVLVRGDGGAILADNTDGTGCVSYLQRCGARFEDARVVVCGTGPTAISILYACANAQAGTLALVSRDAQRAARKVGYRNESIGPGPFDSFWGKMSQRDLVRSTHSDAPPFDVLAYREASDRIHAADIIIDATSLGMHAGDPAPFDTSLLRPGQVVFDVVYGHGETALIAAARAASCRAFDGSGMLVAQAVETIRDIAAVVAGFSVSKDIDLFAIMAQAAGFDLEE